jgi:hypothetical protein
MTQTSNFRMIANQRLEKGQIIELQGNAKLTLQTDRNLVLLDAGNQQKWSTGTNGKAVTHLIMQTDGNLVIYNNATPVWASDTVEPGAGNYLEVDATTWSCTIVRANGTVAKKLYSTITALFTETTTINANPQNPGKIWEAVKVFKFARQQGWEAKMCTAFA